MTAFVALLRGVNVGKAKRVPMADLRGIVEELGGTSVKTLLNSGNVVLDRVRATPSKLALELSAAIEARLKVKVPVIVKSSAEFTAVMKENRLSKHASDHSRLLVAFTQESKALARLSSLSPLTAPPDEFTVGEHAAYLYCAAGILESKLGAALVGKSGESATTRNWATCLKLLSLLCERDA